MGEFTVHSVRFYDYESNATQCMAYEEESNRLALSRCDGAIEIWTCQDCPFLQLVIPAGNDASVEGLAWCGGRLFSVGLHGFLIEYNLSLVSVKSRIAVTGGPTWCVALSPDKRTLAMGTEEGYVCLFDVLDEGVLYNRTLEKQEGRILSLCWHSEGNHIVTGSINCVRLWSLNTGRVTRCSFVHGKREEIIVWCVAVLDDMTIVSGDSRGMVCFWNGVLGTQTDAVQSHKAGVLCLTIGEKQSYVIAAGVDPTIIRLSQTQGKKGKKAKWLSTLKLRVHTHDVRALCLTQEGKLYSGGVDTILACSSYPPKKIIKTPATLYPGYISVGRLSETILLRYKERLELWRLGKAKEIAMSEGQYHLMTENRVKLLELHCREDESIDWCALSPNGLWIAYIVRGNLKIFQFFPPSLDRQVSLRRVRALSKEIEMSRQVLWLAEERLVSVTSTGTIQFIFISDMEATVESVLVPRSPVQSLTSSLDGKLLVVTDMNQGITAYNLEDKTETVLPKHRSPVVCLAIHPLTHDVFIVYSDLVMREYSVQTKRFTDFSKQFLSSREMYNTFAQRTAAIKNVSFNESGSLVFLHDDSSLMVIDREARKTDDDEKTPVAKRGRGNKRRMSDYVNKEINVGRLTIFPRKQKMLYFTHVKDNGILSVEIDSVSLQDQLPPTLKVKKYGGM